jgi:beta-mannosidase
MARCGGAVSRTDWAIMGAMDRTQHARDRAPKTRERWGIMKSFARSLVAIGFTFVCLSSVAASHYYSEGKFGQALNTQFGILRISPRAEYSAAPFTVESWVKLRTGREPNILISNAFREASDHWELLTLGIGPFAIRSGHFSAYIPGYTPSYIVSERDITDDRWHYVAMTFDSREVRLFVDGAEVAHQLVLPVYRKSVSGGGLEIGRASTSGPEDLQSSDPAGCYGLIDEVRISKGIRTVALIPDVPFQADSTTIGLWNMESGSESGVRDISSGRNDARLLRRLGFDDFEREGYKAGPTPFDGPSTAISLKSGNAVYPEAMPIVSLDGEWQMAEEGDGQQRLTTEWPDAIPARVPGSVHGALTDAGKIPDPKFGRNDKIAHDKSFETWWFKRAFERPQGLDGERLVFDGCAIRCIVWLNGTLLGSHEGMFGGPEFDISHLLLDHNTLIVKIDPAPGKKELWDNTDWARTVVFNNVWGWHYSSIPALGVWRSVRVEGTPAVQVLHPFVATIDAQHGAMQMSVDLKGIDANWSGNLIGTIEPDNFSGRPLSFSLPVTSVSAEKRVRLKFTIPEPKFWWPNDLGEHNLYRLRLSFSQPGSRPADSKQVTFGIRTIEMFPQPDGPRPDQYNWTFVINGRPMFVKGANWCTMDSSMNFSRERYDRFLSMAALQHVQLLRAWGSGMPETDDFYDLADHKGIMVLQEWPTAWNSHNDQPYDMLEETVRLNILRIRNHPALVMYTGGNESDRPFGPAIDMMGRYSIELDGTRTFHRGEPWGGSVHNYDSYWGNANLDANLNLGAVFIGEFGLASLPSLESVRRYLPDDEKNLWPAPADGSLIHHTPTFNTYGDMERLSRISGYFTAGVTMERFIYGTQIAQATGLRHTLEQARAGWPNSTGALFYKMNDNYPAASWSTVDWYGAPKFAAYIVQDAFTPLTGTAQFPSFNMKAKALDAPIFLLDDTDALKGSAWEVTVRVFDSQLQMIHSDTYKGSGSIDRTQQVGTFHLSAQQTNTEPLFIVVDVKLNGDLSHRSYYWLNFEQKKDSLFLLPKTTLSLKVDGSNVIVTNTGTVPAVAASIQQPGHSDTFMTSRNFLWINPGESQTIGVNDINGLVVGAWNVLLDEATIEREFNLR